MPKIRTGFRTKEDALAAARANYKRMCAAMNCPTPEGSRVTKEYESFVQHAERGDWSLIDEDDVGMEAPEDSAKYKPLTQKVRIEHQPKDPDAGRVERGNRSRR